VILKKQEYRKGLAYIKPLLVKQEKIFIYIKKRNIIAKSDNVSIKQPIGCN